MAVETGLTVAGFAVAGAGSGRASRWALGRSGAPIRIGAGWCELGTALCWAVLAWLWCSGVVPGWWLPIPLAVTAIGVPLVHADLRHRRLPDVLTLAAYPILAGALTVAAAAGSDPGLLWRALAVAVLFGGVHAVVHALAPSALGVGDVKLAGSLGGVLGACGWAATVVAACLAAVVSALLAGLAALVGSSRWRTGVPHGPGLLLAVALVAVFGGEYGAGPDG
jgi:leader peptidase (prepilin peptidase)/N-methyltransferase